MTMCSEPVSQIFCRVRILFFCIYMQRDRMLLRKIWKYANFAIHAIIRNHKKLIIDTFQLTKQHSFYVSIVSFAPALQEGDLNEK
jgi:hypothetical protein